MVGWNNATIASRKLTTSYTIWYIFIINCFGLFFIFAPIHSPNSQMGDNSKNNLENFSHPVPTHSKWQNSPFFFGFCHTMKTIFSFWNMLLAELNAICIRIARRLLFSPFNFHFHSDNCCITFLVADRHHFQ